MNCSRMAMMAMGLAGALLAGCAAPNLYKAAGENNTIFGYADRKIESNLYRVTYVASSRVGVSYANAYALYRAAELSQAAGASHFEVLEGAMVREFLPEFRLKYPPPAAEEKKAAWDADRLDHPVYTADAFTITRQLADGSERPLYLGNQAPVLPTHAVAARRYVPTYIYIPVAPSPPPIANVSLLVRLHATEPADYASNTKVFSVQEVLKTFGPYIRRPDSESKA